MNGVVTTCPTGTACYGGAITGCLPNWASSTGGTCVLCSTLPTTQYCLNGVVITCPTGTACYGGAITGCLPNWASSTGGTCVLCSILPTTQYCLNAVVTTCPSGATCSGGTIITCASNQFLSGGTCNISPITFEQFKLAFTSNGFPTPTLAQFTNFNDNWVSKGGITSVREAAMFLAEIIHESGGLKYVEEIACVVTKCPGSYRSTGDDPNLYYYGRGYMQVNSKLYSYNTFCYIRYYLVVFFRSMHVCFFFHL